MSEEDKQKLRKRKKKNFNMSREELQQQIERLTEHMKELLKG